jgi:trehalose 6-phosphate synthase
MSDALLVNPTDTRSVARMLRLALDMPLSERRARHEKLLAALRRNDIFAWSSGFLAALAAESDEAQADEGPPRDERHKAQARARTAAV